jgi:hypothetical protein
VDIDFGGIINNHEFNGKKAQLSRKKIAMRNVYIIPSLILLAYFSGDCATFFIENNYYSKYLVELLTKVETFISIIYTLEAKVYLSNLLIFLIVFCICVAVINAIKLSGCKSSGLDSILNSGVLELVNFVMRRMILVFIGFILFFYYPLSIVQDPFNFLEMLLSISQIALWYYWANTIGITIFVVILYFYRRKT